MGSLFQLTSNTLKIAPNTKILKAEEVQTFIEADKILDEAKARAKEILENAEKAYEEQKARGYLDGQTEGKLEHAEKLMETALSSIEFLEKIESTVVDIVNESIIKVIGELDADERIVRIVRTALQHVRNQQQIVIRVAPSDEKAVRSADPRLEQGSCVLESELGIIDASLSTQLKAIENALKNKIKS